MFKKLGPGLLVMAAFIGPGSIATASKAGAQTGFTLGWAIIFSVLATIMLQEMAARLGLVSRQSLAEALRSSFKNPLLGRAAVLLVIAAVGVGNAAYETGNISGAVLGLTDLLAVPEWAAALLIGFSCALLLGSGGYKLLEPVLMLLVLMMSVVFVSTLMLIEVDWSALLSGLFLPQLAQTDVYLVMALIGTTVVPYNLFLHANLVQEKWRNEPLADALRSARTDTAVSVSLGGLITLAVLSTAAVAFFNTTTPFSATTLASQLEPALGVYARYFFSAGLLAAGLTSAITAPLAAAYAVSGALGWQARFDDRRFKMVWLTVLVIGTTFAALGTKPVAAIVFAQAANGLLLPVIAVFLLVVMNRKDLLGQYKNKFWSNFSGLIVVLGVVGLGLFNLARLVLK